MRQLIEMYKADHHRRTGGQGDWSTEAGHRRRARLGATRLHESPSVLPATPVKTRLLRSSERKQPPARTAHRMVEHGQLTKADEVPDESETLLAREELVEARFREEMVERRRAGMLQKRDSEAGETAEQPGISLPLALAGAEQMPRQLQETKETHAPPQQERLSLSSQSVPQAPVKTQQEQAQPPQLGPKELMRQRMLASKHRRQGAAALQSGEAAAALAALTEAQVLTPDDKSLAPLIQRAQVMLGRQDAEAAEAKVAKAPEAAAGGAADGAAQDGSHPARGNALPEGWAEGSLDGTPFYYPVSDPSRIQWSPPLVHPTMGSTEVQ